MRQTPTQNPFTGVKLSLVAAIAIAIAVAACSPVDYESDLQTNKQKWETAEISSYEMDLRRGCFCSDDITRPMHLVVTDGRTTISYADDGSRVTGEALESMLVGGVEKIFDAIDFVLSRNPDRLLIEYDEEFGFPQIIKIDPNADAIDDELDLWITNFRVVEE
jgi:hypothetical protein